MRPSPRGDRNARPDRVAGQLVTEMNVRRIDFEQLATFRLLGCRGPIRHHRVQQGRLHATGHDRDELHQAARRVGEPSGATEHRVGDRCRQLGGRARRQQLRDVERVSPRDGIHLVGPVAGQRSDCALRQWGELDHHRVFGTDRSDRRMEPMPRRRLAGPERQDEQRRKGSDSPSQHRDRVERRIICPVHVLEHQYRRRGRQLHLLDQQRLDVVGRGALGERCPARPRHCRPGLGSGPVAEESKDRRRCRATPSSTSPSRQGTAARATSCRSPVPR